MTIYYEHDFTLEGIPTKFSPLLSTIETDEYEYNFILTQIDDIKKQSFKELYIYEQMKKTDKTVKPNIMVLSQVKSLERDVTYIEFTKKLYSLKNKIKIQKQEIEKHKIKLSTLFTFTDYNLKKYLDLATIYYDDSSEYNLDILMEEIFNNEFGSKTIYYDVRWSMQLDIFLLLLKKSPQDYQSFFKDILQQIFFNDSMFIDNFFAEHPEYDYNMDWLTLELIQQYYMITKERGIA